MSLYIRQLPPHDRPREKLQLAPHSLTTIDLLAILIGSGTKQSSVLEVASKLLTQFGSLSALAEATVEELCMVKGIGPAKAILLKAAFGLGVKLAQESKGERVQIKTAQDAYFMFKPHLENAKEERIMVLLLDAKSFLITRQTIAIGTLTQALTHPREVFYPAIRHKAASIIIAHNHPSGDPTPSKEDLEITRRLQRAGHILGIPLKDHLVIGNNDYVRV